MAKYRLIFLEEGSDHLGEIGHALFDLEKEMASTQAIDTLFRMAHSLKSMAASLGYDPIAELAHRMEDRMEGIARMAAFVASRNWPCSSEVSRRLRRWSQRWRTSRRQRSRTKSCFAY